jgi:hypothetical protein
MALGRAHDHGGPAAVVMGGPGPQRPDTATSRGAQRGRRATKAPQVLVGDDIAEAAILCEHGRPYTPVSIIDEHPLRS